MTLNVCGKLVGITQKGVVCVQQVGLAAESSDALEARNVLEFPLGLGPVEFFCRGTVLSEARNFLSYDLLDGGK